MTELIRGRDPNPHRRLETYYLWRLTEYPRMPGTSDPGYPNLAPFFRTSFMVDFIGQAEQLNIDGSEYKPVIYVFASGPGNGKSLAINASKQFIVRNAERLTQQEGDNSPLAEEINVSTYDYRYALLEAIQTGKIKPGRDRNHTKEDYDEVNPILWGHVEDMLGWKADGHRKNHILILEIPRTTGNERTGPIFQKLAELQNEGKAIVKVIFSQGNPVVRQLGILKRMAIQGTMEMDLETEAKFVFWEWGENRPQSDEDKRRKAGDGGPPSQLKLWNRDINVGVTRWFTEGGRPNPYLKDRVITDPDEFREAVLAPSFYSLPRMEKETTDILALSGRFGNEALCPLMLRDFAVGLEADDYLGGLFGNNRIIVYDAPPFRHLVEPQRRGVPKIGLKSALKIRRGMYHAHGRSIDEYISLVRRNGLEWLDEPIPGVDYYVVNNCKVFL